MSYPCTSCGECCRHIKRAEAFKTVLRPGEPYYRELHEFPYKAKKDGSCEKLQDGKCSVYDSRPDLCNIQTIHDRYYASDPDRSREFYLTTIRNCNQLVLEAQLPVKYLINENLSGKIATSAKEAKSAL